MTTIDSAIFSLYEQGPAPAHTLPFQDEWKDFTRTESNDLKQTGALHNVHADHSAVAQDTFDLLRISSLDAPMESDFDIFSLPYDKPAHQRKAAPVDCDFDFDSIHFDMPAHQKDFLDFPMIGSDAPEAQTQQIRTKDMCKVLAQPVQQQPPQSHALYPTELSDPSCWALETAADAPTGNFYESAVFCPGPEEPLHQSTAPVVAPITTLEAPSQEKGAKPRSRQNKKPVFWTNEEHDKFVAALKRFNGGDQEGLGAGVAELISLSLGTRTVSQVRSHAQKHFLRLRQQ